MGMVHYAEKTVFTAGKNAGEKENKEDQVDEAWKPKISLVCAIHTLDMQMEIDVYIKPRNSRNEAVVFLYVVLL